MSNNKIELPTPTAAAEASSSSAPPPPWIELPEDVTVNILRRLGAEDILKSVEKVCPTWWKICHDPAMWRIVDFKNDAGFDRSHEFNLMCRCAVDRSQGQLIDLSITGFGEDDLLNYVAHRSSNLRCLTLVNPGLMISGRALAEAVKKLPQLKELHLIMMTYLCTDDLESIGMSCPRLRSFTLCEQVYDYEDYSDDDGYYANGYGFAIGKTMPNLSHLRLISILIENEALEVILDGCPHLESLDLRQCNILDLQGDLGRRCCEEIQDLRLPSDSISDIEWSIEASGYDSQYDSDDEDYYRCWVARNFFAH